MKASQRQRGFSIYEGLLALALCGIAIIALNIAAASAAVSSQVAQNRLFVQNLIRAKLAEYRDQVQQLAGAPSVEFQAQSRSAAFEGKVSCSQWRGNPKVYRLTVSIDWTERSREWHREKSMLIIGDEP